MTDSTFMGYRRDDGQVGVRNLIAIIPSCGCALHAAKMIAARPKHAGSAIGLGRLASVTESRLRCLGG